MLFSEKFWIFLKKTGKKQLPNKPIKLSLFIGFLLVYRFSRFFEFLSMFVFFFIFLCFFAQKQYSSQNPPKLPKSSMQHARKSFVMLAPLEPH